MPFAARSRTRCRRDSISIHDRVFAEPFDRLSQTHGQRDLGGDRVERVPNQS